MRQKGGAFQKVRPERGDWTSPFSLTPCFSKVFLSRAPTLNRFNGFTPVRRHWLLAFWLLALPFAICHLPPSHSSHNSHPFPLLLFPTDSQRRRLINLNEVEHTSPGLRRFPVGPSGSDRRYSGFPSEYIPRPESGCVISAHALANFCLTKFRTLP